MDNHLITVELLKQKSNYEWVLDRKEQHIKRLKKNKSSNPFWKSNIKNDLAGIKLIESKVKDIDAQILALINRDIEAHSSD